MDKQMIKEKLAQVFAGLEEDFSGACLLKTADDILLAEARGLANRDWQIPNAIDTPFESASVTKTFTAAAVLLAVKEGLLKLDDKITEIIDLSGTKIPADVTIEQLMNHTSGIADDAEEEAGEDYSDLYITKPCYSVRTCADLLPGFVHKEPNFKAGTDVRYNNCAFVLLALAVEKLTGVDYHGFVTRRIFAVCGMEHSGFFHKDEPGHAVAEGYFTVTDEAGNVKWKKNIFSHPPIGTADGGAYTTVGDLDKFFRAIQAGTLLNRYYSDLFLQPHNVLTRPHTRPIPHGIWRTGYAFEFIEDADTVFCIYKEGGDHGVDAIFSYFPPLDLSLNILANVENGTLWKLYNQMKAVLYEAYCTQ